MCEVLRETQKQLKAKQRIRAKAVHPTFHEEYARRGWRGGK